MKLFVCIVFAVLACASAVQLSSYQSLPLVAPQPKSGYGIGNVGILGAPGILGAAQSLVGPALLGPSVSVGNLGIGVPAPSLITGQLIGVGPRPSPHGVIGLRPSSELEPILVPQGQLPLSSVATDTIINDSAPAAKARALAARATLTKGPHAQWIVPTYRIISTAPGPEPALLLPGRRIGHGHGLGLGLGVSQGVRVGAAY